MRRRYFYNPLVHRNEIDFSGPEGQSVGYIYSVDIYCDCIDNQYISVSATSPTKALEIAQEKVNELNRNASLF